jgi:hypothetical protein
MASSPSFDSAKPCSRRAAVAEIRLWPASDAGKFGQLFLRHQYPSQRVARADAGHIALRRSRVFSAKWLPYAANRLSKEIFNGMFHQPCDGSITLCCKSYFQSQVCDDSAACNSERADVRLGSKAEMTPSDCDVRFTPNSGHPSAQSKCPLWAKSRLMHRSKLLRYSITSSAAMSEHRPLYVVGQPQSQKATIKNVSTRPFAIAPN